MQKLHEKVKLVVVGHVMMGITCQKVKLGVPDASFTCVVEVGKYHTEIRLVLLEISRSLRLN